ncbi:DUF2634 domain-containing protein [Clostridium sp. AWRP]|uniref:DUF2634 domain-containing protein n=1 Tax=Clostridium sp. AWRP TaxID=2212991 RepID=UPI000FD7DA43|nr:DUF2634 domain-containing protein [Clostridium sp. AWRP]AZV56804.1 DUF2634 domain-containing protein [Clostridium sp. AWRP]
MAEDMFPFLPGLQQQIDNIVNKTPTEVKKLGRCFKVDLKTNQFVVQDGKLVELTELEAVEQWIALIVKAYKDKYRVYKGTEFYCNIEDLKGQKLNIFIIAELQREIGESLVKHRYISKVDDFVITQVKDKIDIKCKVTLKDATILDAESEV